MTGVAANARWKKEDGSVKLNWVEMEDGRWEKEAEDKRNERGCRL
jgi:hypothetical protein